MKLGMPILFEYQTVEENLILAKSLGLDFIELNLNFEYCRREMEGGALPKLFKKYGLFATLHFYDEGDFASYGEVTRAYLSLFKKYAKLGRKYVKLINVHLCGGPVITISGTKNYIYEREFDAFSKRLIKNLKAAQKKAKKYGAELVIENTDYLPAFMDSTYELLYECGFSFNYDVGHDRVNKDALLNGVFKRLPISFKEMHIHDSKDDKCHLAIGEGDSDIRVYGEYIKNAYVLLEVKQKNDLTISVPKFKKLFK